MVVDSNLCCGCGGCVSGYDARAKCPVDAIKVDRVAVIDESRCISCGQCAELCALGAIKKE